MLTKQGTGTLTLTGNNSYSGGTLLQEGTLEATSATAFGEGDLYVENGTVLVNTDEPLDVKGNLTMDAGNLDLAIDNDETLLNVDGQLYLDGGDLNLDLSNYEIDKSATITLINADEVKGTFDQITADGYEVAATYDNNSVVAHINTSDTPDPDLPEPEEPDEPVNSEKPEEDRK